MEKNEPAHHGSHRITSNEDELSLRKKHLSEEIDAARHNQALHDNEPDPLIAPVTSSAGMALGVRLSSAFVGTIIAGAFVGWLIDHFFSTSPWGLIILICVGFIGGFLNLLRVLNDQKTPPGVRS